MRRRFYAVFTIVALGVAGIMLSSAGAAQEQPTGFIQGVKTDRQTYQLGDKVILTYAIRNNSQKPISFKFPSSKQWDVWITRGNTEVYRRSRGMMYAQMITRIELAPGETKTFTAEWNQKDFRGSQVGPGPYTVNAQLLPAKAYLATTECTFEVGESNAALVPVTINEAIRRASELEGRKVIIAAIYRGWQPDPSDPNTRPGPPVTRSDWAICDGSGCMYVSGRTNLDPQNDVGTRVTVTGKLKKTEKGQVYLVAENTQAGK